VTGLVSTYSASNAVTDSGAAATALASGAKTDNQYVGMDASGEAVQSFTEEAKERGWRVGYVTTTTITHATPAGFYAHVKNRYADVTEIAL
jgi:alkaline phosphatase